MKMAECDDSPKDGQYSSKAARCLTLQTISVATTAAIARGMPNIPYFRVLDQAAGVVLCEANTEQVIKAKNSRSNNMRFQTSAAAASAGLLSTVAEKYRLRASLATFLENMVS